MEEIVYIPKPQNQKVKKITISINPDIYNQLEQDRLNFRIPISTNINNLINERNKNKEVIDNLKKEIEQKDQMINLNIKQLEQVNKMILEKETQTQPIKKKRNYLQRVFCAILNLEQQ